MSDEKQTAERLERMAQRIEDAMHSERVQSSLVLALLVAKAAGTASVFIGEQGGTVDKASIKDAIDVTVDWILEDIDPKIMSDAEAIGNARRAARTRAEG